MVASRAGACPETTHMSSRDVQLLKTVQNAFKSQPIVLLMFHFLSCVFIIFVFILLIYQKYSIILETCLTLSNRPDYI